MSFFPQMIPKSFLRRPETNKSVNVNSVCRSDKLTTEPTAGIQSYRPHVGGIGVAEAVVEGDEYAASRANQGENKEGNDYVLENAGFKRQVRQHCGDSQSNHTCSLFL